MISTIVVIFVLSRLPFSTISFSFTKEPQRLLVVLSSKNSTNVELRWEFSLGKIDVFSSLDINRYEKDKKSLTLRKLGFFNNVAYSNVNTTLYSLDVNISNGISSGYVAFTIKDVVVQDNNIDGSKADVRLYNYVYELKFTLSNDMEDKISSVELSFICLPRITHLNPQLFSKQGDSVKLQCNATGYPEPRFKWIHRDSNKIIANSSGTSLKISGKRSGGSYCCQVNNYFGKEANCTIVTVKEYQPTKTILTINASYAIRHKSLRILCSAKASPPAHYIIYQGKIELGNFSYGNVTITAGNGTRENISCISKNKYGEGTTAYLSIPIYELPVLIRQPNASNTMTNRNMTLHCKATGIPTPTITWLDDKNNTLDQTSTNRKDGTLQISYRNCSNNTLRYYCEASNTVGRTRTSLITIQVIRYGSTDICSSSKVNVNIENPTVYETSINIKIIVVVVTICILGTLIMVLVFILCLRKKKESKVNTRRPDQNRKYPEEESPYGEPIDAIQVSSLHQTSSGNYTSASNADYATVEETGYKRGGDVNYLPASGIKVDDTAYATVLNSKTHSKKPKAEPVYASVNKKNKKKKNKNNVHPIPLSEDISCNKPASTSDSMRPSSQHYGDHDEQLMNHPDYENALDKCSEKCKNEELDELDGSGQTSTGYSWAY